MVGEGRVGEGRVGEGRGGGELAFPPRLHTYVPILQFYYP